MTRVTLILLLIIFAIMPIATKAYVKYPNHWPYGNPTVVYVNFASSLPSAWAIPLAHSLSAWNQTSSKFRFGVGKQGHDVALKYLWFDNALAVTYIREGSATITADRDTDFNSKYSWDVNGDAGKYDAQAILTHELGHWLTLGDEYNSYEKSNTMYYASDKGETFRRTLESDDRDGARAIYGL